MPRTRAATEKQRKTKKTNASRKASQKASQKASRKAKSHKHTSDEDAAKDREVEHSEAAKDGEAPDAEKTSEEAIVDFLNSTLNFSKDYQVMPELLGKVAGAFAFRARARATGIFVAVKMALKGKTELITHEKTILLKLATSPYVPKLLDFYKNEVGATGNMCADILVTLLYGKSLIEAKVFFLPSFAAQMFRCLQSVHALKIVHGNVSTDNFLVNEDSKLVLADYGNAQELPLPFPDQKPHQVEGSLEFTSQAVDLGKAAMPLDDAEAAALAFLKIAVCRDLPWSNEKDHKKRAAMKDLKVLKGFAPRLIYELIAHLRKLSKIDPAGVPDYDAICSNIFFENKPDSPRKPVKYTAEQHFRINSSKAQRLEAIPFVSREVADTLRKNGLANPAALFAHLSPKIMFKEPSDASDAEVVRSSTAAFERFLTGLKIKSEAAAQIARVFVPAYLML